MNRLEMTSRLKNHFQNDDYYKTIDFNDSIQDGLDEVVAFTGCVTRSAVVNIKGKRSYYDLIELCPNYIGVIGIFNANIKRWLIPTSVRKLDQDRVDWETAYGTPFYFVPINHRYVALYKKPIVDGYGNMYVYYRASASLLDDDEQIPIPEDHLTSLESYCITDLWEQNQEFSKASSYFQEYEKNLNQLRVLIQNKRMPDRAPNLR